MQNTQLPNINANVAAPKVNLNLSAGGDNNAFKQALSREIDQRQNNTGNTNQSTKAAERPNPPRALAPKHAAAPAKPLQNETADAKPSASNDMTAAPAPAKTASIDEENSDQDAAIETQATQTSNPLIDMLALVAAFNQPLMPAVPTGTSASDDAAAASSATVPAADATIAEPTHAAVDPDTLTAAPAVADSSNVEAAALGAVQDQLDGGADFTEALEQAGSSAQSAVDTATLAASKAAARKSDGAELQPASTATRASGDAALTQRASGAHTSAPPLMTDATSKTGADVLAHIESGTAAIDDTRSQITHAQQQSADVEPAQLGGTPKATAINAEAAAALKEQASFTIAPTASHAAQEIAKAATAVPTDKLSSRVGSQAWDQQLGQKIIFMAAGGEQTATMELNPPDLGPLQVVLSVNKDQATAAFSSAAPEVRQALENALPKLKEMMSDAGIQLGSATVSSGMSDQSNSAFNQQAGAAHSGNGGNGGRSGNGYGRDSSANEADAARSAPPQRRLPSGAVDTFA